MHIVVIVAHPDEESIRFGGTIAKLVRQGHKATIIILTRGGLGHATMPVERLRKLRVNEVSKAAEILGADLIVMQDYEDQWISADPLAVARTLIDPLRALKPDIILAEDPTVLPCDQSNGGRGVIDAANKLFFPLLVTEHPAVPIPDIYHLAENNQRPDIYIDITDVIDIKTAAMRCHQTQIHTSEELYWDEAQLVRRPDASRAEEIWIQNLLKLSIRWGKQSGAEYAEAYVAYRSPMRMAQQTLPMRSEAFGGS